jgi:hypothetical protein
MWGKNEHEVLRRMTVRLNLVHYKFYKRKLNKLNGLCLIFSLRTPKIWNSHSEILDFYVHLFICLRSCPMVSSDEKQVIRTWWHQNRGTEIVLPKNYTNQAHLFSHWWFLMTVTFIKTGKGWWGGSSNSGLPSKCEALNQTLVSPPPKKIPKNMF